MVLVPRGKSYDEAEFPGRRELLVVQGGSLLQLGGVSWETCNINASLDGVL